ncbi:Uncharacterised protein [Mycobacteroides abscessus subsp. abscessus]|nr:Uncharacterised protein [Mycobacteroides abscessus subsp. abscessus]
MLMLDSHLRPLLTPLTTERVAAEVMTTIKATFHPLVT